MSYAAMAWAMKQKCGNPLAKMVLVALANEHRDDNGACCPKISRIAETAEMSERSVKRHLGTLRDLGLVDWTYTHRSDGTRSHSAYVLHFDYVPELHLVDYVPDSHLVEEPQVDDMVPDMHLVDYVPETVRLRATVAPQKRPGFEPGTTKPSSSRTPTAPTDQERPDVERLCAHLADRIEANGSSRPTIGKAWRESARLMLDRDKRTEEQIHKAIDWCQDDDFWRTNILSMASLRKQYERLRLKAIAERDAASKSTPKQRDTFHVDYAPPPRRTS